jgi:hypothetical protein
MLRKLLSTIAAVAMLTGMVAGNASAGLFYPDGSTLTIVLGALEPMRVTGSYHNPGWATLSDNNGAHDLTDSAGIWITTNYTVGTSLLTGVSFITNLTLTASNGSGSFTRSWSSPNPVGGGAGLSPSSNTLCPVVGTCLGGNNEAINGQIIVALGGGNQTGPAIDIHPGASTGIGIGGKMSLPLGAATIVVTNGPFLTGKAVITGVTTNLVSMPDRAGTGNLTVPAGVTGVGVVLQPNSTEEVRTFTTGLGFITSNTGNPLEVENTVVVAGTNALQSATASGTVTLVSPMRVDTGALVGVIPAVAVKKFSFVPEPATALLLVSGAAGLIFIGHRRRSKKD